MSFEQLVPMVIFVAVLYGTPGPATLSLAASGAAYGFRKSLAYLFGLASGIFLTYFLVALGLGYLFQNYPIVYNVFKYASLAYILFLSYQIAKSGLVKSETGKSLSYTQGIILNLLNPKAYIAALATISQFTIPGEEYYTSAIVLFSVVIIVAIILNFLWVYFGELLSKIFSSERSAKYVNFILAIVLALSVIYVTFFI